jgi:hypothetical protein
MSKRKTAELATTGATQRVRLFLRLTLDVNDRLRTMTRYHGDLSQFIEQALTSIDLETLELMPGTRGKGPPAITAIVSRYANDRLRATAERRKCSLTMLANSTLTAWIDTAESSPPNEPTPTGELRDRQ